MTVHFIGAGPGAADLVTVRAARIIASAPVCLYAGALVPRELLDTAPDGARLVDTADLDLDQITAELVAAHEAGLDVARLHSGDPSVYSAMAEQMRRLDAAGVPYDVVPGVPAFAAAAASPKRELTVPGWRRPSSSPGPAHAPPRCRPVSSWPPTPRPARRWSCTSRCSDSTTWRRSSPRTTARTARSRWSPGPAGTTSSRCAARSPTSRSK